MILLRLITASAWEILQLTLGQHGLERSQSTYVAFSVVNTTVLYDPQAGWILGQNPVYRGLAVTLYVGFQLPRVIAANSLLFRGQLYCVFHKPRDLFSKPSIQSHATPIWCSAQNPCTFYWSCWKIIWGQLVALWVRVVYECDSWRWSTLDRSVSVVVEPIIAFSKYISTICFLLTLVRIKGFALSRKERGKSYLLT